MRLLRSKSSSNIQIWKKNTDRGRNKHFLVHTSYFKRQGFILPTATSAAKGLASVYEVQVTVEINLSLEGERPHPDGKESFKELRDES